jgi:hypothetical protein
MARSIHLEVDGEHALFGQTIGIAAASRLQDSTVRCRSAGRLAGGQSRDFAAGAGAADCVCAGCWIG